MLNDSLFNFFFSERVADEFWLVGSVTKYMTPRLVHRHIFIPYVTLETLLLRLAENLILHKQSKPHTTVHVIFCVGIPDMVPDSCPVDLVKNLNVLIDKLIHLKQELTAGDSPVVNITVAIVYPPCVKRLHVSEKLGKLAQQFIHFAFRFFNRFTHILNNCNSTEVCHIGEPFQCKYGKYKLKPSHIEDDGVMPTQNCAAMMSDSVDTHVGAMRAAGRYAVCRPRSYDLFQTRALWAALLESEKYCLDAFLSAEEDFVFKEVAVHIDSERFPDSFETPENEGTASITVDGQLKLQISTDITKVFRPYSQDDLQSIGVDQLKNYGQAADMVSAGPPHIRRGAQRLLRVLKNKEALVILARQRDDTRRVAEFRKKIKMIEMSKQPEDESSSEVTQNQPLLPTPTEYSQISAHPVERRHNAKPYERGRGRGLLDYQHLQNANQGRQPYSSANHDPYY